MTVARPIQEGEAGQFLSLLCGVFGLDEARARDVFYADPMFDLGRKWALFLDGRIVSILTTTPLTFGWGRAVGIAGVATDPAKRGRGYAQRLIEAAVASGVQSGETPALLFAVRPDLYARAGFEPLDEVVRGPIRPSGSGPQEPLAYSEVRARYDAWAAASPDRLRRDEARWRSWSWTYRSCEPFGSGYLCHEPLVCREAVVAERQASWPVASGVEWYGLRSLVGLLCVPLERTHTEAVLMGRNLPTPPKLFMTDQF